MEVLQPLVSICHRRSITARGESSSQNTPLLSANQHEANDLFLPPQVQPLFEPLDVTLSMLFVRLDANPVCESPFP